MDFDQYMCIHLGAIHKGHPLKSVIFRSLPLSGGVQNWKKNPPDVHEKYRKNVTTNGIDIENKSIRHEQVLS